MEEEVRDESTNGPPESTPPSIGRRQLLQALGVAAGALAATAFLPNGWTEPAIAAKPPTPIPPTPRTGPEPPPPFPPTATATPTPTVTPTPTSTPTPVANPLRISNLWSSAQYNDQVSFSYSCPGLDINDDNTYMHAEVSPYGKTVERPLSDLLAPKPSDYSKPYTLYLRRYPTSASEGTITFSITRLTTYGVQRPTYYPGSCGVVNATSAALTVWLYTKSNTLTNSSMRVCLPPELRQPYY